MHFIPTASALESLEFFLWIENCRLCTLTLPSGAKLHTVDGSTIHAKRAAMPASHSLAASDEDMAQAVLT